MKTEIKKWALILFAIAAAGVFTPKQSQAKKPGIAISLQVFYDSLDPYGRWINDRQHGYIWIPDAEPGFQPYATRGHWVQTSFGNTWVSDYEWGWAPFHYGRWVFDDYYGWAWIPGDEWGPAWVNWRSGGGYYGWTPMGPGININVNVNIPFARWIFVPQRYICNPRVYSYRVYGNRGVNIYQNTTIINNYYNYNNRRYAAGPRFDEIERVTNRPVRVYAVNDGDRPGRANINRNSVQIYRPSIDRGSTTGAPSRLSTTPDRDRNTSRDANTAVTDRSQNQGVPQRSERPERGVTDRPDAIQQQRDRAEQQSVQRRQSEERIQREPPREQERREEPRQNTSRQEQPRQERSREVQQQPSQRQQPERTNDSGRSSGRPQRVGN